MQETNHESQILSNETRLKKLLIEIEALQKETDSLFSELNMTPEQFAAYVENKENFSPSEWEMLQEQQKKLDEKLSLSLESIQNPKKTRQAFQDLNNSRNWLFVK